MSLRCQSEAGDSPLLVPPDCQFEIQSGLALLLQHINAELTSLSIVVVHRTHRVYDPG